MANGTKNVSIRMDVKLKKDAELLFKELGLNMTTALNVFLKQAVREQCLPFEVSLNVPNKETIAAIKDAKNNRNMSKKFDNASDLLKDLNA
jgi:DNA-damage-inducible protein J